MTLTHSDIDPMIGNLDMVNGTNNKYISRRKRLSSTDLLLLFSYQMFKTVCSLHCLIAHLNLDILS